MKFQAVVNNVMLRMMIFISVAFLLFLCIISSFIMLSVFQCKWTSRT